MKLSSVTLVLFLVAAAHANLGQEIQPDCSNFRNFLQASQQGLTVLQNATLALPPEVDPQFVTTVVREFSHNIQENLRSCQEVVKGRCEMLDRYLEQFDGFLTEVRRASYDDIRVALLDQPYEQMRSIALTGFEAIENYLKECL